MPDDPILPQIILLVILIFINAFFAAAEIALISLSEVKLKKQVEEGDRRAAKLLKLVQVPEKMLSSIQICITLAGYLSAASAATAFAQRLVSWLTETVGFTAIPVSILYPLMVVLITVVLAYFSLVLGELVPKRLAMKKTETVARLTGGVVYAMSIVFSPVIWFLSISTNAVLRLLRVDPKADEEEVSEDEIRMMVDLGEERGTIQKDERELIENIFEFNNTTAEDVMVHRTDMEMIWVEDPADEILQLIQSTGLSRFPVYNEDADDIIGILNTRDYLMNTQSPQPKPFRQLLRSAYFVPESVRTDVLFRDMQSKKVHMAIVVDEYGGTSGLVTMEDLLEEIVGNIYDEFDPQDEQEIVPLGENLWRIAGSTQLENVAEALDIPLPEEEEYDTLGGLVFGQLSVIPEDGSQFEVDALGLHIKVEDFTDRRVEWALVSKLDPTPETNKADT